MGRTLPDQVTHETVVPISYPRICPDRFCNSADELVRSMLSQIAPALLPVDCIEFAMREIQPTRDPARERRFACARSTDHRNPHRFNPLGANAAIAILQIRF